jgi:hypothetical protein
MKWSRIDTVSLLLFREHAKDSWLSWRSIAKYSVFRISSLDFSTIYVYIRQESTSLEQASIFSRQHIFGIKCWDESFEDLLIVHLTSLFLCPRKKLIFSLSYSSFHFLPRLGPRLIYYTMEIIKNLVLC